MKADHNPFGERRAGGRISAIVTDIPNFPESYTEARRRFRSAALAEGWALEACATGEVGPDGEPLMVDAASVGPTSAPRLLIV